ncbi:hypothetical protein V2J09_000974 [Rumex salicifolius]
MASKVDKGTKRKQRYLPHNKPVKKKGAYPLTPGVEGFFITCDGGREHQAAQEALSVIDSYFEDLVEVKDARENEDEGAPVKVSNKKITFTYSDSSDSEGDAHDDEGDRKDANGEDDKDPEKVADPAAGLSDHKEKETQPEENLLENEQVEQPNGDKSEKIEEEPPAKKQCGGDGGNPGVVNTKKSVDKLIEDELKELADKSKRRFLKLESGCNGVVIIKMKKQDGEPGPKEIVQHMMESAASTRKHVARYLLRILPIEVSCYASEEEISRAIKPIITRYFPEESETAVKYAVLYDARANSGIDRMKIIDAVAKSVPKPHKVDLKDPEKSIVVQIVKTVCLIGVVEKYKELAKFNIRQLTSPQQSALMWIPSQLNVWPLSTIESRTTGTGTALAAGIHRKQAYCAFVKRQI